MGPIEWRLDYDKANDFKLNVYSNIDSPTSRSGGIVVPHFFSSHFLIRTTIIKSFSN